MRRAPATVALLAFAFCALLLPGQDPPGFQLPFGASTGNGQTLYPWGTTRGCRVMQAYGSDTLAGNFRRPMRITGIAFRPDEPLQQLQGANWGIRIDLSTCRRPADDLDRIFDHNHGSDRRTVFSDVVEVPTRALGTPPHEFHIRIPFAKSFAWDPACGPLLVDLISSGGAAQLVGLTDGQTDSGGTFGRIMHTTSAAATVANFPSSGGTQHFTSILRLSIDASTAPMILATREGNGSTDLPWNLSQHFHTARVQQIYEGAFTGLRGVHRIESLAWRTEDLHWFVGGRTYSVRVTLSTGRAGLANAPNRFFSSNTGPDAKVVYEGDWTPNGFSPPAYRPHLFEDPLDLQRPFDFNADAGSLVVDIEVFGSSGNLTTAKFDGQLGPGFGFARVHASDVNATSGTTDTLGLAMRIGSTRYRVLPPAFEDGSGTATTESAPWGGASAQRAMQAYDGVALHACQPILIERLSWMPDNVFGQIAYSATIDLSTGSVPAAQIGTQFDGNHGADRIRAFAGRLSLPLEFLAAKRYRLEVELDRPFLWDPTQGPLIVDIRKTSNDGGVLDRFAAASSSQGYSVAHGSDPDATVADVARRNVALAMRLGGDACGALAVPYGAGCPGRSQLVPLNATNGLPQTGNREFAFALVRGPVFQPVTLVTGFAAQTTNLGFLGLPACNLELQPDFITLNAMTDFLGSARIAWPVPANAGFDGTTLFTQWLCLDRQAPGGATVSNGLELVFCHP